MDNLKIFGGNQASVSINGMWDVRKKIFPKTNPVKPTGKKNSKGQIITNPEGLKSLYLETYKQRLRHRPVLDDLKEIKEFKEILFHLRLNLAKTTKNKPWNMKQLDKVLLSFKTKKARDPLGLVNDLFKPGVMGLDFKISLLQFLNLIKEKGLMPDSMQWANFFYYVEFS